MAGVEDERLTGYHWETAGDVLAGEDAGADYSSMNGVIGARRRLARLARTIEGEIIPRLVLAHKTQGGPCRPEEITDALPTGEDVAALTVQVLRSDASDASALIDRVRRRGVPVESIFLDLLAPTARRLGEMWVADTCSFTDVTIGLGRLQQILRELSHACLTDPVGWQSGRRALLVPAACEQHNFGVLIVAEFLRRAAWDVTSEPVSTSEEVAAMVRGEWYAVIGLSLSREDGLEDLAHEIRMIREASRNREIGVLVGGRVFNDDPDAYTRVGADAMAIDGREAALQAEVFHQGAIAV